MCYKESRRECPKEASKERQSQDKNFLRLEVKIVLRGHGKTLMMYLRTLGARQRCQVSRIKQAFPLEQVKQEEE